MQGKAKLHNSEFASLIQIHDCPKVTKYLHMYNLAENTRSDLPSIEIEPKNVWTVSNDSTAWPLSLFTN